MNRNSAIEAAMLIHGWTRRDELSWLYNAAKGKKFVAELGSWHGRSTLVFAEAAERVLCLDAWTHPDSGMWSEELLARGLPFDVFEQNVLNFYGHVRPVVIDLRNTRMVDVLLREYGGLADMVFIDADHTREGVKREIAIAKKLAAPGALICGHDYGRKSWPEVKPTVDASFKVVENPVGTIWVGRDA